GIILYQLLTGRHPFPFHRGKADEVVSRLLEDRRGPPPRVGGNHHDLSPAVEAIVRHCLEPDPPRRYQSAAELRDDLQRQPNHWPLRYAPEPSLRERARKWRRRHPRLTSSTSMGLVAAVFLAALGTLALVRGQRLAQLEALASLARFRDDLKTCQFLLNAF